LKPQPGAEIITLALEVGGVRGQVPDLLRTFVYKEPSSELDALREVLRALPVGVGPIRWLDCSRCDLITHAAGALLVADSIDRKQTR